MAKLSEIIFSPFGSHLFPASVSDLMLLSLRHLVSEATAESYDNNFDKNVLSAEVRIKV